MKKLFLLIAATLLLQNVALSQEIATDDSDNWLTLLSLAKQSREKNHTFRALEYAQKAMTLHPCDTVCRELALCHFARGHYRECINVCQTLLTPTAQNPAPDSSEVYLMSRCYEKLEMADSTIIYQAAEARKNIENQSNTVSFARNLISARMPEVALEYLER